MKKFLSIVLSLCMLLSAMPAFAAEYAADDDTIFYISFDEELPEGSVVNGVTYLDDGVYGKCGQFNGSFSYIQMPDNITVGVTDFTLATWVMLEGTRSWQRLIDFGSGQANNMFLALATNNNIRGAVKVNGGSEEQLTGTGMAKINEWMHVAMVQEGNVRTLYIDGVAVDTKTTTYTANAMGNTHQNYIGKSQYPDPYLNGRLDEILFSKKAMSADEIALLATVELTNEKLLAAVDIPGKESIKENITLPTIVKGYNVTWSSSDEDIVYPYDIPNGDYTIPAGQVTRPAEDTVVTLTASVDYNGTILTKDIDVTIKAKPAPVGETEAYLYVYFRGNVNGEAENQQIFLAESTDGYAWYDMNGNWPIIESKMGTKHLRDPYLLRSVNGDRFYLIATDLDTQDGQGWGPWSESGSKYLMVWESDDLINWSEQRMIKFANEDIGCAWAPEATWDPDTGEYIVYASGKDLTMASPADTVYYVTTRDFRTFSEPKYFLAPTDGNGNRIWAIDSNIIQGKDGRFYHFYKHNSSVINMLVSDHATGPWEEVPAFQSIGGEGPGSFLVKGTEDTYALLVDNYSVYVPYLTTDIASGVFTAGSGTVKMPTGSKHGGFLPVNAEEYARVMEVWGNPEVDQAGTEAKYVYDFEDDVTEYLNGNAKVEYNEERDSNVLVLDGTNSFFQFPEGIFDKQSTFTLSFDVLNDNSATNNMTFSVGTGNKYYYFYKITDTEMRSALTITSWQYEEKAVSNNLGNLNDTWMHIDLVVEPDTMTIYKDGVQVAQGATTKSIYHLATEGLNAYLGKSMYDGDPYFKGMFDNVELYYRALTPGEIAEGTGNTDEDMAKLDAESVSFGRDVNYVTGNITLPEIGVYGSNITWLETSDESVIALDGTVNVPESGSKTVTLKAEFEYKGTKYIKEYVLTVKPVTSYLTSTLESTWTTYNIPVADNTVTYKFNLTAAQAQIDAGIAFAASSVTPSAYGNLAMFVRATTGGYFDAYNGTAYAKVDTVNYEKGKTYAFTIEADITTKKYSVYVEFDGVRKTIAKDYTFRTSAVSTDIGKVMVYAGSGVTTPGLLTVTDLEVILPAEVAFENVAYAAGKVTGKIVAGEALGENVVIVATYNDDGSLNSAKVVVVDIKAGANDFEAPAATENIKVMLWNSVTDTGMVPYVKAIEIE